MPRMGRAALTASALMALCVGVSGAGTALGQPDAPAGHPVQRYDGHVVARVMVMTARELQAVTALADSVWSHHIGVGGEIDAQFGPGKLAALDAMGIKYRVIIPDLQKVVEEETAEVWARAARDDLAWYENYHNLAEINAYVEQLAASRPDLAQMVDVGLSLEGRMIRAIRITGPDQPGNPRSSRPAALYHGAQHAREWITPPAVVWLGEQLLTRYDTDARIRELVNKAEFNLIAVMNVDGYSYTWTDQRFWRKNRRPPNGVDNNRNWGYKWGDRVGATTDPFGETYCGTAPFSEPETAAMRDFILANPRIRAYVDVHSYGQLVMSPWGWTSALPAQPDAAVFSLLYTDMAAAIKATHGVTYRAGPLFGTLYPVSGGSIDWVYGDRGLLAFTYELRGGGSSGFNPPPSLIIPACEETFAALMVLSERIAAPLGFALRDAGPVLIEPETPSSVRVVITDEAGMLDPATARIYTRTSPLDPFVPAGLTMESPEVYLAPLPPTPCGAVVDYYFEAATTAGQTTRFPADAPESFFSGDALESQVVFTDDFETDKGWTVGSPSDTATAGIWERAAPESGARPPADATPAPGTLCFVTDRRRAVEGDEFDVDGGVTTLTSPTFSAAPASVIPVDARISYARWYSNNEGGLPVDDVLSIEISGDDGGTWAPLETISVGGSSWVRRSVLLRSIGVAPTARMKLRVLARDEGADSNVNAALDDVEVVAYFCSATTNPADLNGDGIVDFADYLEFLTLFEAMDPRVDFNQDGIVDFLDYLEFLNYFGM